MRRSRLERAISDAGFASAREFAVAVGCHERVLNRWIACRENPSRRSKRRIAEALDLCWGADSDSVWLADVDWLLEPCDATA